MDDLAQSSFVIKASSFAGSISAWCEAARCTCWQDIEFFGTEEMLHLYKPRSVSGFSLQGNKKKKWPQWRLLQEIKDEEQTVHVQHLSDTVSPARQ